MIDILISIIVSMVNSIINILPEQIGNLSVNTFSSNINFWNSYLANTFNFIDSFFPIAFIFTILGIVISAEIFHSFIVRGIFWIIRTVRGG